MSDAEWRVIEPTLPAPAWKAGKGGRPAGRCRRDYVDAIRYLVKEGIQWRAMPADLPHWRTVCDVADGWHRSGATGKMHDELRRQCRIAAGRAPEPTAAVVDSQSVRVSEEVSRASRGYDAGKKVDGRRRHIAVDTVGLLLTVMVTAAGSRTATAPRPCCGICARRFKSALFTARSTMNGPVCPANNYNLAHSHNINSYNLNFSQETIEYGTRPAENVRGA